MEPRLLLQWLLDRDKDNSNSLAAKLKNATTQPQIHKFLSGKSKQPRHSTLEPIAKHYGIPIDALYNEDVADQVMATMIATGQPSATAPWACWLTWPQTRTTSSGWHARPWR